MFILGCLSIIQIIFLPGFIFLKFFRIKTENPIESVLYSFGLSLFINYPIVCLFTFWGIYTNITIYFLFIAEILLLNYCYPLIDLYRRQTHTRIKDLFLSITGLTKEYSFFHIIVFFTACFIILFFISFLFINSPILFFTDAIYSWNRWAIDWALNKFPYDTSHYPQLFSANLSLCYVFINNTALQFFPKIIMPLFTIGILLAFFDLSFVKKSLVNLTGLIIYGCILIVLYSLLFISDCNADIPTAFLGFLAFYTIDRRHGFSLNESYDIKTILMVIIFASASANTKMAGLYILFLSLIWIALNIYRNRKKITGNELLKIFLCLTIVFTSSFFWYIIKPADMYHGLNQSQFLPNSYWERIINAIKMLYFSFGPYLFLFLLVTVLFSLSEKTSRYIAAFTIAPIFLLWAFFFSYDFRNLSIAIPFVALASSYGMKFIYKKLISYLTAKQPLFYTKKTNNILEKFLFVSILIIVIIFTSTDFCFNLGIKISYLLNKYYFHYYKIEYTFDHGYYKYVEYFLNTTRVSSLILLVGFVLRKSSIKTTYVIIPCIVFIIVLSFDVFSEKNLFVKQKNNYELLTARNLYSLSYPVIANKNKVNMISNSYWFSKLVPLQSSDFYYIGNITPLIIEKYKNSEQDYLLLQKDKLIDETKKYIEKGFADKSYNMIFDDGKFIFLKAGKNIADF
jgi:hypothetical protein